MTDVQTPFEQAEYDRRLNLTRAAMAAAGLDVLFVADPSNMAWLTGYDGWSFYTPQGVILTHEGDPVWWGRGMDAQGALRTVWMSPDHVRGYADDLVQTPDAHPMQDLAEFLRPLIAPGARIGVEMDNYYYAARSHAVLSQSLPDMELIDATALVGWQRVVKSDAELAFMRKAARIAEAVVSLALERAAPGVPQNQLAADILHKAVTGVEGAWGDYPAIMPMMPSGADASAPHLTWSDRPLQSGEGTFFELSGCYRRYHVPLCRTVFLGEPPDEMRRASDALTEGLEAGLDAARAGNRACDVAQALNDTLARVGIDRGARCGYSIGLSYPPDWGEGTVSLRLSDETVLRPGMTFHFMPGLWMKGWGLETTESILIRETGPAEPFCNMPRQLFVKP